MKYFQNFSSGNLHACCDPQVLTASVSPAAHLLPRLLLLLLGDGDHRDVEHRLLLLLNDGDQSDFEHRLLLLLGDGDHCDVVVMSFPLLLLTILPSTSPA